MQGKDSKSRYVLNVETLLSLLHNHPIYYFQSHIYYAVILKSIKYFVLMVAIHKFKFLLK